MELSGWEWLHIAAALAELSLKHPALAPVVILIVVACLIAELKGLV
jgi:hypothetical protein